MRVSLSLFASTSLALAACGQSAQFGGPNLMAVNRVATADASKAPEVLTLSSFTYALSVADGAPVVAQGMVTAVPKVFGTDRQTPVTGSELAAWSVAVHLSGAEAPAFGAVEGVQLDLSKASGMVTTQADFKEVAGSRKGIALASLFVDGEKPHVNLLRLENASDGKSSKLYWSAVDN